MSIELTTFRVVPVGNFWDEKGLWVALAMGGIRRCKIVGQKSGKEAYVDGDGCLQVQLPQDYTWRERATLEEELTECEFEIIEVVQLPEAQVYFYG